MRHLLPVRARLNWWIALLTVLLALGLAGALFVDGGDTRTATAALGPGWSCTPNLLGTVCVRDVTRTAAKR